MVRSFTMGYLRKFVKENPKLKSTVVVIVGDEVGSEPLWDGHVLSFGGEPIWEVSTQAKNVRSVLDKFQSEGWPEYVDFPRECSESVTARKETRKLMNQRQGSLRFGIRGSQIRWSPSKVNQGDDQR